MPEEQNDEQQEALEPAESDTPEEVAEPLYSEADIQALKAKAEKADEYKGYAARVAAENKRLKKQIPKPTENLETNDPISRSDEKPEWAERLELKTDGYSDSEVDQIMELGGKAALQNPILKDGLAQQRKKAKSQEATPSGTAKSPAFKGVTEKDLKTMPLSDFEKLVTEE